MEGYPFIMFLELIYKVCAELRRGKIVMCMDQKHLIIDMMHNTMKASCYNKDCGAIKSRFKETQEKLDVLLIIKCSLNDTKPS